MTKYKHTINWTPIIGVLSASVLGFSFILSLAWIDKREYFDYTSIQSINDHPTSGFGLIWGKRSEKKLTMTNKKIRVHMTDFYTTQQKCDWHSPKHNDEGGDPVYMSGGCTKTIGDWSDIYIPAEAPLMSMLHELCHADGSYEPDECGTMFP